MKIVISSGHGKHIRGARGNPVPPQLDEVDEARKVVERVADALRELGVDVTTFHDDTSHDQSTNLNTIVNFHNKQGPHDWDVSIHFNAYNHTAHGCEVLYVSDTGHEMAKEMVDSICISSGLTNRGAKLRSDLKFLNATNEPAVLVETCFCDNTSDSNIYRSRFDNICNSIAGALAGEEVDEPDEPDEPDELPDGVLFSATGTCSWFGGPDDTGVSPTEDLAFIYDLDEAPHLFLQKQPSGTSGLARRLDPGVFYLACRWDYSVTSKITLRDSGWMARVTNKKTGVSRLAHPADWGPHEEQTGRAADLSPALMENLGLNTDDEVEVIYPWEA